MTMRRMGYDVTKVPGRDTERTTMLRKTLATCGLTIILALGALAGTSLAASKDCNTDAANAVAAATVTYLGNSWGPTPLYEVDLRPTVNATVDVAANSADEARTAVLPTVEAQMGCAPPPSTTTTTTQAPAAPAPDYTAQATDLLATASITYLGNSWGPVPLWEAALPSLNATVDIAANTADDARTALVSVVAGMLAGQPAPPPPAPVQPATTTTATVTTQAPLAPAAPATTSATTTQAAPAAPATTTVAQIITAHQATQEAAAALPAPSTYGNGTNVPKPALDALTNYDVALSKELTALGTGGALTP